jgi:maleamate amidohydrolase
MTQEPATPTPLFTPYAGGELLDGDERAGLAAAGYAGEAGQARRPVLLVVDVTWGFCGRSREASLTEAVTRYPHASGRAAWRAMPAIRTLVDSARRRAVPMVFTRPSPPNRRPMGPTGWDHKNARHREVPKDAFEVVGESGFRPSDLVLDKEAPSAFFGTPLRRWLTSWHADGVVVCGGTTSGCVRATAVDAFSSGLAVTVAADASFDRVAISHRVSLLDLELKYAGVRTTERIVREWEESDGAHAAARSDDLGEEVTAADG